MPDSKTQHFAERYGPWAVIVGAADGVGRAYAHQIAREGVNVLLVDRAASRLESLAEEIRRETNAECATAVVDLATAEAFDQIAAAAGDREVGLYVSNAGGDASSSRFLDQDIGAWLDLVRVNVMTAMQSCHYFGGKMRERRRGGLLITNSFGCYGGGSYLATYNGSKAFLMCFAESLWIELRPYNVDVLSMMLDITDTPNLRVILGKAGLPMPASAAAPEAVAAFALARLDRGPVQNWALEENETGRAVPASAAARRERVLAMDAYTQNVMYPGEK